MLQDGSEDSRNSVDLRTLIGGSRICGQCWSTTNFCRSSRWESPGRVTGYRHSWRGDLTSCTKKHTGIPSGALLILTLQGTLWSGACGGGPVGNTLVRSLAVEVRRGTLWSRGCCWGPAGNTLILSLLFGSGGENCDLELAVESQAESVWRMNPRMKGHWFRAFKIWLTYISPTFDTGDVATARPKVDTVDGHMIDGEILHKRDMVIMVVISFSYLNTVKKLCGGHRWTMVDDWFLCLWRKHRTEPSGIHRWIMEFRIVMDYCIYPLVN